MDGYSLQPDVISRLYRMLRWYEAGGHGQPPRVEQLPRLIPHELRRFELAAALTPGSSALAWLRKWDEDADDYATSDDTDLQFTVYDALGNRRGRAKDAYASPHDAGSRGLAWKPHDCARWEIVDLTPHALMIRGVTTGAVAGEATFTLAAGVTVYQPTGGIIVTQDPAAAVTVQNGDFVWTIDSGDPANAFWNEDGDNWQAVQAKCPG